MDAYIVLHRRCFFSGVLHREARGGRRSHARPGGKILGLTLSGKVPNGNQSGMRFAASERRNSVQILDLKGKK
jgi:hypothetical protein